MAIGEWRPLGYTTSNIVCTDVSRGNVGITCPQPSITPLKTLYGDAVTTKYDSCPLCNYQFPDDLEEAAIAAHSSTHSAADYEVKVAEVKRWVSREKTEAQQKIDAAQTVLDRVQKWTPSANPPSAVESSPKTGPA